jgi:hypothetical protein
MLSVRALVVVTLVGLSCRGTAFGAVLCQKKSGAVFVRAATCKKKEVVVDLTTFAAVGPKGDQGPKGDPAPIDASLPSGTTEIGVFSGGFSLTAVPSGATELTIPIALRVALAASIPEANAIRVTGVDGSAPHCPGKGQADPGYFCLYETFNYGSATFTEFDDAFESAGGISRYGTSLSYNAVARRNIILGTWAVTAP